MFESWFVQYKVHLVFAGHVHAYERWNFLTLLKFVIVSQRNAYPILPYDIDNGNCTPVKTYQRLYMQILRRKTASYYACIESIGWVCCEADTLWINNRYWHPVDESTAHTSTCPTLAPA
ncbi:hypothetical protein Leryth_004370 [Lithospermum erythrorhizon]|nr:hypothetical protein Leryth_004370 [Lithospermum erythrorhizon]